MVYNKTVNVFFLSYKNTIKDAKADSTVYVLNNKLAECKVFKRLELENYISVINPLCS